MLKDKKTCLAYVLPEIVNEWHFVKNKVLSPENVSWSSGKKVWWKCKKGHEWQAKVSNRVSVNHSGCPYCANKKVYKDNCLATLNPELASEWHPTKNRKLTPNDVIYGSHKKVWWKCKKGHEWEAKVVDRINGTNCPYCANKKVCKDNCLDALNPELANEWHPTKNKGLTPHDVTWGSNKTVWWKCKKGHEWRAKVSDRNRGKGCRSCFGVTLKDGTTCASFVEAYFYIKYKNDGIHFLHNKRYSHTWGGSRYDFYIPSQNKYVEVTSFDKNYVYYFSYLRNIVIKKRYVESELKGKFVFISKKLSMEETCIVKNNMEI